MCNHFEYSEEVDHPVEKILFGQAGPDTGDLPVT